MFRPLGLKREGACYYKHVGPTGLKTPLVSCYFAANFCALLRNALDRMRVAGSVGAGLKIGGQFDEGALFGIR